MNPAVLLFPLASFLALHLAVASTTNTSCTPARCGKLSISYPFSLRDVQPLYCGYPAFELTCDVGVGRTYLGRTFRDHMYRISDIFYDNSSLVMAVETSFPGYSSCPVPDFNVSSGLYLLPANISTNNKNLVFVYNCTPPSSNPRPVSCGPNMTAYIADSGVRQFPKNCSYSIFPVRGFGRVQASEYLQLIRDGFLVVWTAQGDCPKCQRRGGECKFVELSFQCVCSDGLPCPDSGKEIFTTNVQ